MKKVDDEEKEETEEVEEEYEHKSHVFFHFIIIVIIIGVGFIFYSKYIGTKGLITKEYRVESNILAREYSGLKIVHFSDVYYKSTFYKNDLIKLVEKINDLKPDIIVFTGDLVSPFVKLKSDDLNDLKEQLSLMDAKIAKYAIYGDNDYNFKDFNIIMEESGFTILNNSYDEIYYNSNVPIYMVGIPSSIKEKTNLDESFKFYNDENRNYIIVLAHDAKTIKNIDESTYETDLILCGHNLGGIIRFPIIGGVIYDKNAYKYKSDHNKKGITDIFVSSGLGTNENDYRFMNTPSFNLYRLKSKK